MKFAAIAIMAAGATAVNVTEVVQSEIAPPTSCRWTDPVYETCSKHWWIEYTCSSDWYYYATTSEMNPYTKFYMNDKKWC